MTSEPAPGLPYALRYRVELSEAGRVQGQDLVHIAEAAAYESETTAKNQFPTSTTAANYDNAWDFKGGATGITYSSRVILVKDVAGTIQDAASFKGSGAAPGAFPGQLQAIQAAGQWLPANCGGEPGSKSGPG